MTKDTTRPAAGERAGSRRTGLAGRRRALVIVVTGSLALGALGLGAAAVVKSPAQVAADTAPPPRDTLTAPVERQTLSRTFVTRGSVVAAQTVDVAAGDPAGEDAGRAVVTKVNAKTGDRVTAGRVLLEVSGRPVFALPGALPAYRDLKAGARGKDVAQLQRALTAVGHSTGADEAGSFGAGTRRAVTALYAAAGYEPAAGALVPMSEVVYLNGQPARVDAVTAKVGADAGDKLMTLSAGALLVTGEVAPHERELVKPGRQVRILAESTGQQAVGKVVSVAGTPTVRKGGPGSGDEEQQGGGSYTVEIKPDRPLPADLAHQDVRLTIAAATSDGKVLSVPSSAVSAGADGRTTVTVREADGSDRRVEVRVGMSGDGVVEVAPAGGARLAEGEQVVVGVGARRGAEEARR
ncbi:HlyD family efflux transporter periplasmic adaptor subunit [Streptomyces sp. NPDC017056]|uniref:HlyD family efflux transporter periplasmic adaptor subunit n=1 Tax=Streptomyces sp. NPDC017056 TaxID=3364973 RepID=UPI0037B20650